MDLLLRHRPTSASRKKRSFGGGVLNEGQLGVAGIMKISSRCLACSVSVG